jgi:mannose-6-phosphate isomerase-like protein (cupin superfamily)
VLIDRSETALSEVGLNHWRAGLEGPPHFHDLKEQVFFVTDGKGTVVVSGESFEVNRGDLVYVPMGAMHRTLADPEQALEYLLFMSYKDAEKEGQATFSEHVAEAKQVRRRQADRAAQGMPVDWSRSARVGQHFTISSVTDMDMSKDSRTTLLDTDETQRCRVCVLRQTSTREKLLHDSGDWETVLFALEGSGHIRTDDRSIPIATHHVAYIPNGCSVKLRANRGAQFHLLCLSTMVD